MAYVMDSQCALFLSVKIKIYICSPGWEFKIKTCPATVLEAYTSVLMFKCKVNVRARKRGICLCFTAVAGCDFLQTHKA